MMKELSDCDVKYAQVDFQLIEQSSFKMRFLFENGGGWQSILAEGQLFFDKLFISLFDQQ